MSTASWMCAPAAFVLQHSWNDLERRIRQYHDGASDNTTPYHPDFFMAMLINEAYSHACNFAPNTEQAGECMLSLPLTYPSCFIR